MKYRWMAAALLALPAPAAACSLCGPDLLQAPTFRQEAAQPTARVILHGKVKDARLKDGGRGETDLQVEAVVRGDAARKVKVGDVVVLPRWTPATGKPQFVFFCDVYDGKLDPYRGVLVKGAATVEYVKKALALGAKDPVGNLAFFFKHLDDADPEVARDAFLEFAKANDQDLLRAAPKFSAAKLRVWIKDPKTPAINVSVYAVLLGACGNAADAAFLRKMLDDKTERSASAYDGLLAGYLHLEPEKGWALALATLGDNTKPLTTRLAVVRTLRFAYGAKPKDNRANVLKGMEVVLKQGELADLAVEDLRGWGVWDLTDKVLAVYGKKGYDSPLMQRAVLRYALSAKPTRETAAFLAKRRADEPELVKEVEEGLRLEKGT